MKNIKLFREFFDQEGLNESKETLNDTVDYIKKELVYDHFAIVDDEEFANTFDNNLDKAWEQYIKEQELGQCQSIVSHIKQMNLDGVKTHFGEIEVEFGSVDYDNEYISDENYLFTHHWVTIGGDIYEFSKGTLADNIDWSNINSVDSEGEEKYLKIKSKINESKDTQIDKLKSLFLNNGWNKDDINDLQEDNYFSSFEFVTDSKIKVYRNITVLEDETEEFENTYFNNDIGEYWSLSDNTRAIWGDRGDGMDNKRVEYQCVGLLDINDIGWGKLREAFDDFYPHFVEEKEIRAKNSNKDIRIQKCYKE